MHHHTSNNITIFLPSYINLHMKTTMIRSLFPLLLPLLLISWAIHESPVSAQQPVTAVPDKPPPPPKKPPPPPPPPVKPPPPPPPPKKPPPPPPPPMKPPPPPKKPPPPPKPVKPRIVRCRSLLFPTCFNRWYFCPVDCPTNCFVDCVSCKPVCTCNIPGALCQDPRFVGGDGVTFYFHGHKDQDFCLLSDTNLHINGHFIGKRDPKLTRDFTWVQSLGILFDDHKLLIGAKKTSIWDDNEEHLLISFDDTPLSIDRSYHNSSLLITRTTPTNGIVVEVENSFRITASVVPIGEHESKVHGYNITKEDCFAHLELGFKFYGLSDNVDGVLGQTYRREYVSKMKVSANMPVMGDIPKYTTSGIFATDCPISRFGRRQNGDDPVMDSGEGF